VKIISWKNFLKGAVEKNTPSAATIGVFDGVHKGHLFLLKKILSKDEVFKPVVFTFSTNPARILDPREYPGDITNNRQKFDLFSNMGIKTTVLIDFSANFSKLSGRDFLSKISDMLQLRCMILGSDFRCGYRADTNAEAVAGILSGVKTEILEPVDMGGEKISSTRIRNEVLRGNFKLVAEMLGRNYQIDLTCIKKGGMLKRDLSDGDLVECSLEDFREKISNVFPECGVYPVELLNSSNSFHTKIHIDSVNIRWKQPNGFIYEIIKFE